MHPLWPHWSTLLLWLLLSPAVLYVVMALGTCLYLWIVCHPRKGPHA
jgi:hypothetical protein